MFEYKILKLSVTEAEKAMNNMARNGYRVIAVTPNIAIGHGLIVTFEKETKEKEEKLNEPVKNPIYYV